MLTQLACRIDRAISGEVTAGLASSADDRHENVRLEGSIDSLAWYATVFNRHTGDYHIPGFAAAHCACPELPGTE